MKATLSTLCGCTRELELVGSCPPILSFPLFPEIEVCRGEDDDNAVEVRVRHFKLERKSEATLKAWYKEVSP